MNSLRLLSFTLAALASMLLFVKHNDRLGGKPWPEVGERLSIVATFAVCAGGSLEAFMQHAQFGWRIPAFMACCLSLLFFLWAGRNRA